MTKVVVNKCFGGFGLSKTALVAYAEKAGITLYPEKRNAYHTTYWTKPPSEERNSNDDALWHWDIARDDANLVAVVEELGAQASDQLAQLEIVEVPDDEPWEIDEYDGLERVVAPIEVYG